MLDAFPCLADEEGRMVGVIVMRRVKGKTLKEWMSSNPSAAKREKMAKALEQAVGRLHSESASPLIWTNKKYRLRRR